MQHLCLLGGAGTDVAAGEVIGLKEFTEVTELGRTHGQDSFGDVGGEAGTIG